MEECLEGEVLLYHYARMDVIVIVIDAHLHVLIWSSISFCSAPSSGLGRARITDPVPWLV
jgi:hypothetical protein